MGFNQVFVKFVDICTVLQTLERDLKDMTPMPECSSLIGELQPSRIYLSEPVTDDALEAEMFERSRGEVLESWKTGYCAEDLSANAEFLAVSLRLRRRRLSQQRAYAGADSTARRMPLRANNLLSSRLSSVWGAGTFISSRFTHTK